MTDQSPPTDDTGGPAAGENADESDRIVDQYLIERFSDACGRRAFESFRREHGRREHRTASPAGEPPVRGLRRRAPDARAVPAQRAGHGTALRLALGIVVVVLLFWYGRGSTPGTALARDPSSAGSLARADGTLVASLRETESAKVVGPGSVRLGLDTALVLTARQEAALTVNRLDRTRGGVELTQLAGTVVYELDPAARLPVLILLPGEVRVRVTGTAWRIAITASGAEVAVAQGRVEVITRDGSRAIERAQRVRIDRSGGPNAPEWFNVLADPDFGGSRDGVVEGTTR